MVFVEIQLRGQCLQRRAGMGEKVCQRGGAVIEGMDGRADGVAVGSEPGDEALQAIYRAGEFVAITGQRCRHGVQVVDQMLDDVVVVGQCRGER